MRIFATLVLLLAAATSHAAADPPAPETTQATTEFLLDSAAADFRKHGPDPAALRNVRFGFIESEGEGRLYLLCGEVQPASGRDTGKWIEFATLRTSGYEQWLGSQGGSYCNRPGTSWEAGDLSAALRRRVDESRPKAAPTGQAR